MLLHVTSRRNATSIKSLGLLSCADAAQLEPRPIGFGSEGSQRERVQLFWAPDDEPNLLEKLVEQITTLAEKASLQVEDLVVFKCRDSLTDSEDFVSPPGVKHHCGKSILYISEFEAWVKRAVRPEELAEENYEDWLSKIRCRIRELREPWRDG